ncbi:MMPL family transporter [Nocardioides marinus]|uniref:RND superfamily putative drug exporter n=1 Tax=Nocardioides marinus TaxID=374514 RepID=A0A7Z0C154_9ACTN|nr:MMPL family transporter [Nocardioides marinus]NYI08618.1 RND superfamily putative drug exporter [Nocardioides marinus]
MTSTAPHPPSTPSRVPNGPGPLGRLGTWVLDHRRLVAAVWALLIVGLGIFAPRVEHDLSGAGWQADGSDSVAARDLAVEHFGGNASSAIQVVVRSSDGPVTEGEGAEVIAEVTALLEEDPRIATIVPPQPGATLSQDGDTGVVLAGAGADTNEMVRAATDLKEELAALSTDTVEVTPTGSSLLWSDFNDANLEAMLKSELMSWPVTLAILVLAFGALVAAGLPLILTLAGLVASAGSLVLINQLVPVSIWAMNFAMMFALALGIDYALFLVVRYRAARAAHPGPEGVRWAVAQTMDTAGKAVLLSGLTVLISLSAVMLVPSPSFRSMAGGIMLSVVFVLGATLTLLPLVLGWLDDRINRFSLPWSRSGEHRSPRFAAWGERLWARPWTWGLVSLLVLLALAAPILGLKTAMPSIKVLPEDASARVGYDVVQAELGEGAPGAIGVVVDSDQAAATLKVLADDPGLAGVLPGMKAADGADLEMFTAVPTVDPSDPELAQTVDRLRADLPSSALVGGAAVENLDLKSQLDESTPIVVAVVLALGFLLLLVALQAPLISLLGTLVSLLSTAAAFGVARLVFQEGYGADLLGFESQGFLDAWAPVFFFAMIFAIAMDYTVFLLASAKEHYERSGDPHEAMVGSLAHSGRVIFAAGAVMVAVFFTFALSGPIPPKEMGIVLGVAVLLDAFLVRLVLLPVLLRLTGRAAWWSPAWLRRVLPTISFAHD